MHLEDGVELALKKAGVCTECRLRFAEPHSFWCWECLNAYRKRAKKRYDKNKNNQEYMEHLRELRRNRYHKLKEQGRCTKCGNKLDGPSTVHCNKCRRKQKIRYENNKWKKNKNVY